MDEIGVGNACATPVTGDYDTRQRGWYAQVVFQFTPNWRAGLRYDQLDSGRQNLGTNRTVGMMHAVRQSRAVQELPDLAGHRLITQCGQLHDLDFGVGHRGGAHRHLGAGLRRHVARHLQIDRA